MRPGRRHALLPMHLALYVNYQGFSVLSRSCCASGVFHYSYKVSTRRCIHGPVMGGIYPGGIPLQYDTDQVELDHWDTDSNPIGY